MERTETQSQRDVCQVRETVLVPATERWETAEGGVLQVHAEEETMIAIGKKARKAMGGVSRVVVQRAHKHVSRPDKRFRDGKMTPEAYRAAKASKRHQKDL